MMAIAMAMARAEAMALVTAMQAMARARAMSQIVWTEKTWITAFVNISTTVSHRHGNNPRPRRRGQDQERRQEVWRREGGKILSTHGNAWGRIMLST